MQAAEAKLFLLMQTCALTLTLTTAPLLPSAIYTLNHDAYTV
jgi:hypothetical protein